MIKFTDIESSEPYSLFTNSYNNALKHNQNAIEAIVISSFDKDKNEVDSRFVNLKYIIKDEWIFFSNYQSPKANQFNLHDQISAIFYWNEINVQIRMKALIKKSNEDFSDLHFNSREHSKNALAISSHQSQVTSSYDKVKENFKEIINKDVSSLSRPDYWGGYSFKPYYFEFWKGDKNRLNKRDKYELNNNVWEHSILQP